MKPLFLLGLLWCLPQAVLALSCPEVTVAKTQSVASFEGMGDNPFWSRFGVLGWSYEQGADSRVVRIDPHNYLAASRWTGLETNWQGYDVLRFRARSSDSYEQSLSVEIHDTQSKDYWSRNNSYFAVGPEWKTYSLNLLAFVGEKSVIGDRRRLGLAAIKRLVFSAHSASAGIELDDIELVRLADYTQRFDGLRLFDFGTDQSPLMQGWVGVHSDTVYSDEVGYGFAAPQAKHGVRRSEDRRHPTALLRDWVDVAGSRFKVNLPNGDYTLWLMMEDAGYWEYYPNRPQLSIEAEGYRLYQENRDVSDFWRRYYANEKRQDRAGDDPFNDYIRPRYQPLLLNVPVRDGRLELSFQALPGSATLSAMAIYPSAHATQGQAFTDELWQRMHAEYCANHQQRPGWGGEAPHEDLLLQRMSLDDLELLEDNPPIVLAANETAAHLLQLIPNDSGAALKVSLLSAGAGAQLHSVTTKFRRTMMDGSSYRSEPWLVKPLAKSLAGDVEHYLLLELDGAAFRGEQVTVHVEQGTQSYDLAIPVKRHKLPLPSLNLQAGYLGSMALYPNAPYREVGQRQHRDYLESLKVMAKHGMTAASGGQGGPKYSNGRVAMDKAYASLAAYAKVFSSPPLSYMGMEIEHLPGEDSGPYAAALEQVTQAVNTSTRALKLPPVFWSIADEPQNGTALEQVRRRARTYRKAGAKTQVFTSFAGPDDPTAVLAGEVDLVLLNLHTESALKWIRQKNSACGLYNQHGRYQRGVYLFGLAQRYGCEYYYQFAWSSVGADPYYALDAREDDIAAVVTSSQGLVRTLGLLRLRQALADYRYLQLLAQQDSAAAQALLKTTLSGSHASEWTEGDFARLRLSISSLATP